MPDAKDFVHAITSFVEPTQHKVNKAQRMRTWACQFDFLYLYIFYFRG